MPKSLFVIPRLGTLRLAIVAPVKESKSPSDEAPALCADPGSADAGRSGGFASRAHGRFFT